VTVCSVTVSVNASVPPGKAVSGVVSLASPVARKSAAEVVEGNRPPPAATAHGTFTVTPGGMRPRVGSRKMRTDCESPSFNSPLAGITRSELRRKESLSRISTCAEPSVAETAKPPVAADRVTVSLSVGSLMRSLTTVKVTVLSAWSALVKVSVRIAASVG